MIVEESPESPESPERKNAGAGWISRLRRVSKRALGIFEKSNNSERERSGESSVSGFAEITLKVGGETRIANLHTADRRSTIEESVLHLPFVIITRSTDEKTSYVYRTTIDGQWSCVKAEVDADSGSVATERLDNPFSPFAMAADAEAKERGFFLSITLPEGSTVLTIGERDAEIAEIQRVTETQTTNPSEMLGEQGAHHQKIIDAVERMQPK